VHASPGYGALRRPVGYCAMSAQDSLALYLGPKGAWARVRGVFSAGGCTVSLTNAVGVALPPPVKFSMLHRAARNKIKPWLFPIGVPKGNN
jgi:hypothetical protein